MKRSVALLIDGNKNNLRQDNLEERLNSQRRFQSTKIPVNEDAIGEVGISEFGFTKPSPLMVKN
jgi:hypothetical protein